MRLSVPLFALCCATPVWGNDAVSTFTLDNGLEAVVIEDTRAPVVVHMLWYKVGSADEPAGKSGIAHYLEHLMFKGTDDLGPGEFSEIVEANGGSDNAFTSFDYTGYFQRVASDRLGLMMEMEADRMTDLSLASDAFNVERDVVLEERAQRTESSPDALFREQARAAQFLNHPYGRPIIGWRHEIEELSLQDALDFYETHYAPNNAVLVVAGDVSEDEVRALAEEHYGPIPRSETLPERARPTDPPQLVARRMQMEDPRIANPYVTRSYLAPNRKPGDQKEAAALSLLASLLGGSSTTSLLAQELQHQEPARALYTAAGYGGLALDDTTFSLVVLPVPGRSLEEAEADMDAVIAKFMDEGVDSEKLVRLKAQLRASEIYERDSARGQAQLYGAALTSGLTVEDVAAWPDIVAAVTEEDIMAAAANLFDIRTSVTGWLTRPGAEEVSQ